jgi:class 3 adenylate cyclase
MDCRGFTNLALNKPEDEKKFFEAYHKMVAHVVNSQGGFIHKTVGDGHYISFGVMDEEVDLSGIPGVEFDEPFERQRKRGDLVMHAVDAAGEIIKRFYDLRLELKLSETLAVGATIDFGNVECRFFGDPKVRLEFDASGPTVVRCARLESYTKSIIQERGVSHCILLLSEDAAQRTPIERSLPFTQ